MQPKFKAGDILYFEGGLMQTIIIIYDVIENHFNIEYRYQTLFNNIERYREAFSHFASGSNICRFSVKIN